MKVEPVSQLASVSTVTATVEKNDFAISRTLKANISLHILFVLIRLIRAGQTVSFSPVHCNSCFALSGSNVIWQLRKSVTIIDLLSLYSCHLCTLETKKCDFKLQLTSLGAGAFHWLFVLLVMKATFIHNFTLKIGLCKLHVPTCVKLLRCVFKRGILWVQFLAGSWKNGIPSYLRVLKILASFQTFLNL